MRVDLACYLRQYARPERLRIGRWACAAAIQGQGCVVHEFSWSKEASSTSSRSTGFFPVVSAARGAGGAGGGSLEGASGRGGGGRKGARGRSPGWKSGAVRPG